MAGCTRCQRNRQRIQSIAEFKRRLQGGGNSHNEESTVTNRVFPNDPHAESKPEIHKSVNTEYKRNDYVPPKKKSNVGSPRITKYGWVAFCTICQEEGKPAQLPSLATVQCDCKDIDENDTAN